MSLWLLVVVMVICASEEPLCRSLAWGAQATVIRPIAIDSPRMRPNPSLERTCTGIALGPRGAHCHHSPRGPSAIPALSAQLKR